MSKRKPNNMRARMERSLRAILVTNHVAVVCVETADRQGVINWKNCCNIGRSYGIQEAICDIAHRWTIYVGVMCQTPGGEQYLRSGEFEPQGNYLSRHLSEVIEAAHKEVIGQANPNHVVASGWIAIPYQATLTEQQAARVFAAVGGWEQKTQHETNQQTSTAAQKAAAHSLAA